jgi:hypothetical protein
VQEVERAADDVGLPLTGDSWGERLAIKAKGGGMHFDDDSRRAATAAFQRLGTLRQAVTWHLQLTSRGKQITSAVGGFRAIGGSGASMSKAKLLDKMSELLGAVSKTIKDIFSDGAFRVVTSDMSRQGLPQSFEIAQKIYTLYVKQGAVHMVNLNASQYPLPPVLVPSCAFFC